MNRKSKGSEKDARSGGEILADKTPAAAEYDLPLPVDADFSYGAEDEDEGPGSAEDTARYISDMVGALAAMAGEARLDLLTYLLNMARVEAELQARQSETADDED
jgi:hypothetical protein